MESINIIEGLLTAAIKALPVEDFYRLRGEEPPKAGTDLTKATSEELAQALTSEELTQALIERGDEIFLLREVTSSELAQALIDQGEEVELLNQVDITEYIDFESCVDAYGSDQVLDYVECCLCINDVLDRLDEDEVAAWVAGNGRTVLTHSIEYIVKEFGAVLHKHAEDAE